MNINILIDVILKSKNTKYKKKYHMLFTSFFNKVGGTIDSFNDLRNFTLINSLKNDYSNINKNIDMMSGGGINYNDEFFYLFINMVYIEKLFNRYKINVPHHTVKNIIKYIIENSCYSKKVNLNKCISTHKHHISVIPLSQFNSNTSDSCSTERTSLEKCINIPFLLEGMYNKST